MIATPNPSIDIDGVLVARALDLEVERFRQLMADGGSVCANAAPAGLAATAPALFRPRARFLLDTEGQLLGSG